MAKAVKQDLDLSTRTPKGTPDGAFDATTVTLVRRLIKNYLRPHLGWIVLGLILASVSAGTAAGFTQLIKPIIDDIFIAKDSTMLLPVATFALAIFVTRGIATFLEAIVLGIVGGRVVEMLQNDLFARVVHADLAFYHRNSPGLIISRFANDIFAIRNTAAKTLTSFGKDTMTAIALTAVMFHEDWRLALISFFAFPLAVWPIARIGRMVRKSTTSNQASRARLTALLDEVFQGIRYVKAYTMEKFEMARAEATFNEIYHIALKVTRTRNIMHPVMESLSGLAIIAVILWGGHQVIDGAKAPGSFFSFIVALMLAYEPIKRLAGLNAALQEGLAALARVFQLMDRGTEIQDQENAGALVVHQGEVKLEGVGFSYDEEVAALKGVDITAPAGRSIALVGPSGAGKTTVLNLIPRFFNPDRGRILVDGQDIAGVSLESLRSKIALVSQEVILFDDSVKANIAYGRPDASDEEIIAAAKGAGAHDFISQMPKGYDTLVGPRGINVSGGQRQRISIARAMLKDAPILLLDEATSALDTESERHVQQALRLLMRNRTTIVIAHRLSTIIDADIIYVLDQGLVVEQGTHQELLQRGGIYARLSSMQSITLEGASEIAPESDSHDHPRHGLPVG